MKKRILGILLALCMVLCIVPTSVFAEGKVLSVNADITGSGTAEDPYLIYTAEGLKAFRDKANGGERNAFATLMEDIVLNDGTFDADGNYTAADGSAAEPEKWTPISTDNNQYRGTFDGNGKTVKGLYVNTGGDEPAGLFGYTGGPKIKNLTVDGCVIGKDWAGGILGFSHGGVIENCTNNASVTVANLNSDTHANVGGIAGVTGAKLIGCGNTGKITVKNVARIANVGGLVGQQNNVGFPLIHDCYNTGDVSGEAGTLYLGGIAGAIAQGVVSNCYSTGKLDSTGSTTVYLGGIVGLNAILYDLTNNYYLEGTADKAAGRDEAEMVDKNTVKPMPKEAFGDGTILNLMINGREDGTHPWGGECGYVKSAGMVLPILKREESIYAHTHCVCGTGSDFDGHDTHTDVTWTPWTKTDRLPTKSGYYFLTDDVVMNIDQTTSSEGIYICLNGYGIKIADTEDESNNPSLVLNGGTLTVTDCGTKGTVNDITIYSGKLTMYGGSVPTASGLTIAESGEFIAAGNAAFNGTVTNKGTISAGIFNGEVINEMGTVNGGTFNGKVTSNGGTINNGTFNGVVDLYRYPTRNGDSAVIVNNGIFTETSTVNNIGSSIYGGTYSGKVTVTGYINPLNGGGMTGVILGGIYTKSSEVTALTTNPGNLAGIICGGDFYGKVKLEGGVIDDFDSKTWPIFHESSEVYFTSGSAGGGIYYGTEIYGDAKICGGAYCTVVFKTDGGSRVPDQKVLRGKKAAPLAENPTKAGYAFGGWLRNGAPFDLAATPFVDYDAELTAVWSQRTDYTVKFSTDGGTNIADKTNMKWTDKVLDGIADPVKSGYAFMGWRCGDITVNAETTYADLAENDGVTGITLTARWKDTEKPTGEIKIGENKWRTFLNKLTLGLFFKDTQTVEITAADNSGMVFVGYLVTEQDLTVEDLKSALYADYDGSFNIEPNGKYIVYVMLTDESLNITYLRSDRITIDNISPVIAGIENGKTYCAEQTVTVDEEYIDTVTVNGTAVTLDENNSFVLSPADGEQEIIVADKAGNTVEMTVTVNDGHTFGEWASNGNGTHTHKCTVDGCNASETKYCSGGKATCTEKAVCEVCGKTYGELDPKSHANLKHVPAKKATETSDGNIEYWYCDGCDKYYSDAAAAEEILKADTVIKFMSDAPEVPRTENHGNLTAWIITLLVGGAVFCVLSYGRRKKHKPEDFVSEKE